MAFLLRMLLYGVLNAVSGVSIGLVWDFLRYHLGPINRGCQFWSFKIEEDTFTRAAKIIKGVEMVALNRMDVFYLQDSRGILEAMMSHNFTEKLIYTAVYISASTEL